MVILHFLYMKEKNMETSEKIIKQVRFADGVKNNDTYIPLAKPRTAALRKLWLQRSRKKEYEQLEKDLLSYQKKGLTVKKFFSREGDTLLDWAITNTPSAKSLEFICENIPSDLIQEKLSKGKYSLLNTFLIGEADMEEYGEIDRENLRNQLQKIRLLLMIDPEGVGAVLRESLSTGRIREEIKAGIEHILLETKLSTSFTIK